MTNELLSAKQIAERFGVRLDTVHSWARQGCPHQRKGPGYGRGGALLFDPVKVRKWLDWRDDQIRKGLRRGRVWGT